MKGKPGLKAFCQEHPRRLGGRPCFVCQLPPDLLEEVNAGIGTYSYPQIASYIESVTGQRISSSAVGNHARAGCHSQTNHVD